MTLLAADDRAYLSVGTPVRYALGNPAAPMVTFNAVDAQGVMWLCDEPQGWDSPTVATPFDRKQYGDGAYAGQGYLEERTLTFSGAFAAPTNALAVAARDQLRAALLGDLLNGVIYTHLDEQPARSMVLLPSGSPRLPVNDRVCEFSFTLIAADPYKYGPSGTYGPARLPSATGNPGRSYPRVYPVTYGALGSLPTGAAITVPNAGDTASEAIYAVQGPVPGPVIALSNGLFIGFTLTLAATDSLIIDTAAGSAQVNGVNRLDALLADSTFPLIPTGGVDVHLTSTAGGTDQAAGLLVTTAPTWK